MSETRADRCVDDPVGMADRHPADSRTLPNVGMAPTSAPVVRVIDVLVALTSRSHEVDDEDFDNHPPAAEDGPVDLGHGLQIESLPYDDAELVMNACSPRGHFFIPTRQYGQRYSYVFDVSLESWRENPFGWDPEGRINAALHLARLVRDNSDSMDYAARIVIHEDGERQVVPRHDCERGRAYSLLPGRDWLDVHEASELRALLDAYWAVAGELPDRVVRALQRTSHLPTERYVDDRLAGAVIALESLVNAGPGRVSRQFRDRVAKLGAELQVPDVSRTWTRKIYDARSRGVHGDHIDLFYGPQRTQSTGYVARLESVLRRAVRQCIEDPEFRARFADAAAVEAWCPIPEPKGMVGRAADALRAAVSWRPGR